MSGCGPDLFRSELRALGNNLYLSRNRIAGMIFSMPKKITLPDLFPNMSEQQINEIAEILPGYC
jgi:hypothetical protein